MWACRAEVIRYADALRISEELRQDKVHSIVLDPAPRSNRFGLVERVADALGGEYIPLTELRADAIRKAVRRVQDQAQGEHL